MNPASWSYAANGGAGVVPGAYQAAQQYAAYAGSNPALYQQSVRPTPAPCRGQEVIANSCTAAPPDSGLEPVAQLYAAALQQQQQQQQQPAAAAAQQPSPSQPGQAPPAAATGAGGAPRPNLAATACLFIYNLPPETDESYLYQLFSPYGAVVNVKVGDAAAAARGWPGGAELYLTCVRPARAALTVLAADR